MKSLLLALLTSLLTVSVQAQTTNSSPATGVRLQGVVKRDGASSTNAHDQLGTNVGKHSEPRMIKVDELFIGTLLAIDKQKHTVSIAHGPPAKAQRDKPNLFFLTPETKFFNGEIPATLDDAVIGQAVRYGLRIDQKDGKRQVTILRFSPSPKPEANK